MFVCVCLPECMSVYHTRVEAYRSQKRAGALQDLELEMVVSHHLVLGTKPRAPTRAVSALENKTVSPVSQIIYSYSNS